MRSIVALLLLLIPGSMVFADKTDIVVLTNGDRITGEVKSLDAGILSFSTDAMGTIAIEWRFIERLISTANQSVELVSGERYLGTLNKEEEGEALVIEGPYGAEEVAANEIVSVWPVEATFWERLDVALSAGFDYAKSTDITNLNIAFDADYRTEERFSRLLFRSYITQQPEVEDQNRNELSFEHQYFLPDLKYRAWFLAAETNDSLGIDLRLGGGGGFGRYFVKNNRQQWSGLVGLLATRENADDGTSETNLEAVLNTRHRYFRFADPERSWDTALSLFPSLTDAGRYRADFRSTFRLELIDDFFWALEAYANYDSDPVSENAEKSDYGITTSLGWSN